MEECKERKRRKTRRMARGEERKRKHGGKR
jgi:hypothetical protein